MPGGQCCGVGGRSRSANAPVASVAAATVGGGEAARGSQIAVLFIVRPKPRGGPSNCTAVNVAGSVPSRPTKGALRPKRRPPPSNCLLLQSTADCSMTNMLGILNCGNAGAAIGAVDETSILSVADTDTLLHSSGTVKHAMNDPVSAWTAIKPSEFRRRLRSRIMRALRSSRTAKRRGG